MANPAKILERGTDGIAFEALIPASQPGDVFPAGTVVDYAGASAPTGWLICDGTAVSRATYPTLFANIGTQFGAGDGSTTFNLPDLRGKIPVGKHSSGTFVTLGATGGEENHALSVAEMPSHNHGGTTGTQAAFNTATESALHTHSNVFGLFDSAAGGLTDAHKIASANSNAAQLSNVTINMATESATHVHQVPAHAHSVSSQGGGGSHNNMPPYVVLNKIIRAY